MDTCLKSCLVEEQEMPNRDVNNNSEYQSNSLVLPSLDCGVYGRSRTDVPDDENFFELVKKECNELGTRPHGEKPEHNNYEPLGILGVGSRGLVMKVRKKHKNIILARKSIPIVWSESSNTMSGGIGGESSKKYWAQSAIREIRFLRCMSSPYIVKFEGAYVFGREIFILMEYADIGNLSYVSSVAGPIEEPNLVKICFQILKGLEYLSRINIVHRDIKPTNLLLSSDGIVKIADFGVSTDIFSDQNLDPYTGTHGYLAPELNSPLCKSIFGHMKETLSPPVTPKHNTAHLLHKQHNTRNKSKTLLYTIPKNIRSTDLWSLGVVLLELAMGRYPYPNILTTIELIACLHQEPPPELPRESFSRAIRKVIFLCLVKDPLKRSTPSRILSHKSFKSLWPKNELLDDLVKLVKEKGEPKQEKTPSFDRKTL